MLPPSSSGGGLLGSALGSFTHPMKAVDCARGGNTVNTVDPLVGSPRILESA
jgi:hypothetical protein